MLHGENYFAELRSSFEIRVRGGSFRERKNTIDDGLQTARGDELHDCQQFRLRSHIGPEQRKLPAEKKTQIDLCVIASRCAAGHQAAGKSKARHTFVPRRGADMLEHHVYAPLIRDAAHFFADSLRLVVDDVVGAKLAGLRQLLIGSCSGDDARAEKLGDLNPGGADTAAGS